MRRAGTLAISAALVTSALASSARAEERVVVKRDRTATISKLLVASEGKLVERSAIPALEATVLAGRGAWAKLDARALAREVAGLAARSDAKLGWIEADTVSRAAEGCCGGDGFEPRDPLEEAKRAEQLAWPRRALGLAGSTASARDVIVAVLDTGVDREHPLLADAILDAESVVEDDRDPTDRNGHGTAMVGILVARGEGALDPRGIAPGARVLSIKVMDDRGTGSVATLARGVVRAVERHARVILVSAGVAAPSRLLEDAVRFARDHGALVVAAAGNEPLTRALHPARTPGVLGVTASRDKGLLALDAALDPAIELAAPGDEVLTTLPRALGVKAVIGGTSASAAFVAGTAALAFGRGATSPEHVLRILRGARREVAALAPIAHRLSLGELDAGLALARLESARIALDSVQALPAVARPGATITVRARVRQAGGVVATSGTLTIASNGRVLARTTVGTLPADGSSVAIDVKVTIPGTIPPEELGLVATMSCDGSEEARTLVLPVVRGERVARVEVASATLDEERGELALDLENVGESPTSPRVSAAIDALSLLPRTLPEAIVSGARARATFALPREMPERVRVTFNVDGREGCVEARVAGRDPRPVRPQYQQGNGVDLIADAPWRVIPGRSYVPVMVFAVSKGDMGNALDLLIDRASITALDAPAATSGKTLYDFTVGQRASAAAGTELVDEDLAATNRLELFAGKPITQNGRHELIRIPRSALGVANAPGSSVVKYLSVKLHFVSRRLLPTGQVALEQDDYRKVLRVELAPKGFPRLPGDGRYLDTHFHTVAEWYFTDPWDVLAPRNNYGGPIAMILESSYALGLADSLQPKAGTIITTDHSCFYNEQDPLADTTKRRIPVGPTSPDRSRDAAGNVKKKHDRYKELFGVTASEEVAVDAIHNNHFALPLPLGSHLLAFRAPHFEEAWNGRDIGGSPNVRKFGKGTLKLEEVLGTLATLDPTANKDAFIYSAHPFSEQGWSDAQLEEGLDAKYLNAAAQSFSMKGHELWNGRGARHLAKSKIDWRDLNPWADADFAKGVSSTHSSVEKGLQIYRNQLSKLLRFEREPGRVFSRKLYVAAGSDAHGDFNYSESRASSMLNLKSTFSVSDSAFARVRTYVLEDGLTASADERGIRGLAAGNTVVTDGPLATLALDADARFDARTLTYHAGSSRFEDEDGRIGGGGLVDGARTALVVAGGRDATWSYRYEEADVKVNALELYAVEDGITPSVRRLPGRDAPGAAGTLPVAGAGKTHVVAARGSSAAIGFDRLACVQLGAFAGADPAKGDSPATSQRCYTNPVWVSPVKAEVLARGSSGGAIGKGSLRLRFTFAQSMDPRAYAIEVKALDAQGNSTDGSVAGVPMSGTWSSANGVTDSVLEVENARDLSLAQPEWPRAGAVTFVVYFREAPRDTFGNELNRIAFAVEVPRVGVTGVAATTSSAGPTGFTAPASTAVGGGRSGGGGGCALLASNGGSALAFAPLVAVVVLAIGARRRAGV